MSVLPEVSDLPALSVDYFPTPWQVLSRVMRKYNSVTYEVGRYCQE